MSRRTDRHAAVRPIETGVGPHQTAASHRSSRQVTNARARRSRSSMAAEAPEELLIAVMVARADSLDDMGLLRHPVARPTPVGCGPPATSTVPTGTGPTTPSSRGSMGASSSAHAVRPDDGDGSGDGVEIGLAAGRAPRTACPTQAASASTAVATATTHSHRRGGRSGRPLPCLSARRSGEKVSDVDAPEGNPSTRPLTRCADCALGRLGECRSPAS